MSVLRSESAEEAASAQLRLLMALEAQCSEATGPEAANKSQTGYDRQ